MCEFKVYLDGEKVWEDVVFAISEREGVTLKDIMGESRIYVGARIAEVNVMNTRLVLEGKK